METIHNLDQAYSRDILNLEDVAQPFCVLVMIKYPHTNEYNVYLSQGFSTVKVMLWIKWGYRNNNEVMYSIGSKYCWYGMG